MVGSSASFATCEICGADSWSPVRRGPVRDGSFGNLTGPTAEIARCGGCGVERLDETSCTDAEAYESSAYREKLKQTISTDGFFEEHDILQIHNLSALWPDSIRGRAVADIGCAAGSFLDHVHGLVAEAVAVEPFSGYHGSLRSRGYAVYDYADTAASEWAGKIERAFTFSVVEHVKDPRTFLTEIGSLLTPTGELLLSTPNRADALMALLPDEYPAFFYRTVHRWYFDAASLASLADAAGFAVVEVRHVHRYGLSNAMRWMRDRRPGGREVLPNVDTRLDALWQRHLESVGTSDYLYARLRPL